MAKRTGTKFFVILEAAVKTFAQTGYHRTRVADIARHAGVADGTVYIYFESKEDILISLFQDLMARFVDELNSELSRHQSANDKLAAIITYHLTTLGNRPDQAKVTQIELRQIDPSINNGISKPLLSYFRLIEEVINEGKEQGLYRQNLNTRTARKVIFGAVDEMVTCWVMSNKPYDLSALSDSVFELLVKGLE
ncbi:MAG TPA: TetR/AcrR family transcriptional regulator [Candidatus Limnocylindrales bacterium]|nr:TetR/AcrR family transcriptional regulator [Candidatus Limnocylindrales bacterium]